MKGPQNQIWKTFVPKSLYYSFFSGNYCTIINLLVRYYSPACEALNLALYGIIEIKTTKDTIRLRTMKYVVIYPI